MTDPRNPRPNVRVRGRSFMALALVPQAPLDTWLAELDAQIKRAPNFFNSRPVVLDVAMMPRNDPDLARLAGEFSSRHIKLLGVEGTEPGFTPPAAWDWPPLLAGGRPVGVSEVPEEKGPPEPVNLLREEHVRSGQSVSFPKGDVTIVGSVASGAEVIAGNSIHIYGTLRGRAIAGAAGDARARIFCRKLEAELIAVDGVYLTADDIAANVRGKPAKISLDGDKLLITPME